MAVWNAIPWITILKQAPIILGAAEALLASTRRRPTVGATIDEQSLRQRLDQIEEHQRANAEVVKQLADQVNALAAAAHVDAAKTRLAVTLGIIGVALGLVACVLAWYL